MAKFQLKTDAQIAKALLRPGSESRRALVAKGQLVGIQYRRLFRENAAERALSPFEQKQQLSVGDPAAFHVRVQGDELEISVEAPAAQYVEEGTHGAEGHDYLKIPLKDTAVIRQRKKGKKSKKSIRLGPQSFVSKTNGKLFLYTRRVKPAKGRHLLRRAIRSIFLR